MFVAGVTSLPEHVVTIGAHRLGALDLVTFNLRGCNLFDIAVLAVDHLAYAKAHAVRAFASAIMTDIEIITLLYRPAVPLLVAAQLMVSI